MDIRELADQSCAAQIQNKLLFAAEQQSIICRLLSAPLPSTPDPEVKPAPPIYR
jgi:hypothetical protein